MAVTNALILPFRKKLGQSQFLVHRELIPSWDPVSDLCGMAVEGPPERLEALALEMLESRYGIKIRQDALKGLGLCMAGRNSEDCWYLYAVDLSGDKAGDGFGTVIEPASPEPVEDKPFWVGPEWVMESLDAPLIACFAKVVHLFL